MSWIKFYKRLYKLNDNSELVERLKGKLLLAVEQEGKVFYTNRWGETFIVNDKNYLEVFREMSLGIDNENLNKLNLQ